jgi:septum formation protein
VALVTAPIHLVLASASPARRRLLLQAGIEPTIYVSDVDEALVEAQARERHGDLGPAEVALLLARAKAEAVAAELSDGDHVVLGCDSVLELDGAILGKPATAAEAVERWRAMRGHSGVLHTGHWLVDDRADGTGGTVGAAVDTAVHFADLDDREIDDYVATGEPLRVAGAFTIDGLGAPYVRGIEGDHTNVIGLSLPVLRELLLDIGIHWSQVMTPR